MALTWKQLAAQIEEINRSNGWYDKARTEDESVLLILSEMMEAFEALRKGKDTPSEHIPQYTAWQEELADTIIRFLDTVVRGELISEWEPLAAGETIAQTEPLYSWKRSRISLLRQALVDANEQIQEAFEWALYEMKREKVDVEAILLAKLDFNRTRGYRHGGKQI